MANEYKKFKLVYGAENKDIKGSLSGIPAKEDPVIVTLDNYDAKLVYENAKHELKASLSGIPAEGDRVIGTRKELEGIEVGAKAEEETAKSPAPEASVDGQADSGVAEEKAVEEPAAPQEEVKPVTKSVKSSKK